MACWADHFNTWDDYCAYAGIDTPAQLAAEAREEAADEAIATQDAMEAAGGPLPRYFGDDIPF